MYKVVTYKDRAGNDEVAEYIRSLNDKIATNKNARIRYKKIMEYIGKLQTYGLIAGEPAMKHINNTRLWELRPTSDRIFLFTGKTTFMCFFPTLSKRRQKLRREKLSERSEI
jgi:phage-related protein